MSVDQTTIFIEKLRKGHTFLYPTDTIWGLGCDPFNAESVEEIYKIKNRDRDKPLILLVESIEHAKRYVKSLHPRVETILHYYDKPVTVIYESNGILPNSLCSKDRTIAIRVVDHRYCKKLIKRFGKPLVSTSANIQGEPFPSSFHEIDERIKSQVDMMVTPNIADTEKSTPSVILSFTEEGELKFIRD